MPFCLRLFRPHFARWGLSEPLLLCRRASDPSPCCSQRPQKRTAACCARPAAESSTSHRHHQPVLLSETLQVFSSCSVSTFVDGTIGAGGHSAAVIDAHPELRHLVGIDVDPRALQLAAERLDTAAKRAGATVTLQQGNFSALQQIVQTQAVQLGLSKGHGVSGIVLDVGVSSMQLDEPERGFSFTRDGPLDMRMGPSAKRSAADLVNTLSEADLGAIFRDFGEERYWRRLAHNVCQGRTHAPLQTTHQLLAALHMPHKSFYVKGKKQIHPATRAFQVRMDVSSISTGATLVCMLKFKPLLFLQYSLPLPDTPYVPAYTSCAAYGALLPRFQLTQPLQPPQPPIQALRMAVNGELEALEAVIPQAIDCLHSGGRLAIITFHSLEDRLVKHAFLRAAGRKHPEPGELGALQVSHLISQLFGPDVAAGYILLQNIAGAASRTGEPQAEALDAPRGTQSFVRIVVLGHLLGGLQMLVLLCSNPVVLSGEVLVEGAYALYCLSEMKLHDSYYHDFGCFCLLILI